VACLSVSDWLDLLPQQPTSPNCPPTSHRLPRSVLFPFLSTHSELLGSFGDNELSPECLDGAQRFLKPDGVSIPQAYTSYLQPITSHKLWNDVRVGVSGVGSVAGCTGGLLGRLLAFQWLLDDAAALSAALSAHSSPLSHAACLHALPCSLQAYDDIEHFETAYVVKLFKIHPLAPTQVCAFSGLVSVWDLHGW
jgi:hypothetical protein